MSIKIIKPGICSTVQDEGRTGHRYLGIGPGGVMDFFAASVANYLVGNEKNVPVFEMHFPAATLLFQTDAIISITGADFDAHINDAPISLYQPVFIKMNSILSFKKNCSGVRTYMAIQGGIIADQWLGSYSTQIKLKVGGFEGRILQKEDEVTLKATAKSNKKIFSITPKIVNNIYNDKSSIRFIIGPEYPLLNTVSKKIFSSSAFVISNQSDRMGYRLNGQALFLKKIVEFISSPVGFGTIQLLPNGNLIVLMADHQTSGGYPRIASVITADLPRLAQLPVNAAINFKLVTLSEAEEILISMHQTIDEIHIGCKKNYATH
ncbi:MAG: biotin-dependent carboxyltransferase family protein [Ferruginibacter sp.]